MRSRKIGLTALALAAIVLPGPRAGADAIAPTWTYWTSGDIGATAGVPIGSFDFQGKSGQLLTPGSFSLGQFDALDLPPGAGLTYNNLPFYITLYLNKPGPGFFPQTSEIDIRGVLNGTVTGTTSSNVIATITSVQWGGWSSPPPFPLSAFAVDVPQVLAPSGINGGHTALMARVGPSVPEPGTLALFGIAGLGLLARRVSRRRS